MDTFERNHHHHHRFKFRLFFFPRKLLCRSLLACVRRAKRERAAHARPSIVATCSPACEFMNCFCCHLFSGRTARMTVTLPRYILNRYNAIYNRAHPSKLDNNSCSRPCYSYSRNYYAIEREIGRSYFNGINQRYTKFPSSFHRGHSRTRKTNQIQFYIRLSRSFSTFFL